MNFLAEKTVAEAISNVNVLCILYLGRLGPMAG